MKYLYVLLLIMISFKSFAYGDPSCLINSTFTISVNADGSANPNDLKGQVQFDLMAGGQYAFLSANGPNYLFSVKRFYMVFEYLPDEDIFLSMDGKLSFDTYCSKKELVLVQECDESKRITFKKIK